MRAVKVLRALPRNIICLFEFLSIRRFKVIVKVRLSVCLVGVLFFGH